MEDGEKCAIKIQVAFDSKLSSIKLLDK